MQLTTALLSTGLLSATAFAAPATAVPRQAAQWTMQNMVRTCAEDKSTCSWQFSIWTGDGVEATPCEYVVNATEEGVPADQAPGGPVACGIFTVTSNWSDYFPDAPSTSMSVIDYATGRIVYPGYLDSDVADGQVVVPDRSFDVEAIPSD